ncbi:hypothetical protein VPHK406_0064 [Vibrio phage K406]
MEIKSIDHVTEGLSKFTSRLDHEELKNFVSIFLERYQKVEDSLLVLSNQKSIDLAEGVWLDYIGQLLGIPREGLSDIDYRLKLRTRILSSNADGTPNKVIQLVKDFTSSAALENPSVMYRHQNLTYAVLVINSQTNIGKDLYSLVEDIRPAGVNLKLMNDFNDNALYFAYEKEQEDDVGFQVKVDSSTLENFQITFDGINLEDYALVDQPFEYYEPSLRGDQNSFYYEEGIEFQVSEDGITYSNLELESPDITKKELQALVPYLPDYVPSNVRPFLWEITDDTVDFRYQTLTDYDEVYKLLSLDFSQTVNNLVKI